VPPGRPPQRSITLEADAQHWLDVATSLAVVIGVAPS
jgi:hypothetical protein